MTTAQLDHLRAIEAHLDRLLAIAAKRTPGEWEVDQSITWDKARGIHPQIVQRNAYLTAEDAAFIASCSNNAEAGWRSTKGAIGWLLRVYDRCDEPTSEYAKEALEGIIAEWPLETLKP